MKDVLFQRALISHQPSPLQISPDAILSVVARSAASFELMDLTTNSTLSIVTKLTNQIGNLVLYDEDISISTNISDTEVTSLRWLGQYLLALTNNLNLLVLKRTAISRTSYSLIYNVNKLLIDHHEINTLNIIKFQDLLKLRIHSFAFACDDFLSRTHFPSVFAIGLENGTISILQLRKEKLDVVIDNIEIGSKPIVALEWSKWINDISYISVVLNDNSIYVLRFRLSSQVEFMDLKFIREPSKSLVSLIKWNDQFLNIISTDKFQTYEAESGITSEVEIGTIYAITDFCYLPGDIILLINGFSYLGVFTMTGSKVVKVATLDYNSAKSLESFQYNGLNFLKRKLITLNAKYNNISIRGITTDPLSKIFYLGYVQNDPPLEARRMRQISFKVLSLTINSSLSIEELEKMNFQKISPKNVVNLLNTTKLDVLWDVVLQEVKLKPVEIPKDISDVADAIQFNLDRNIEAFNLLHLANQLKFHLKFDVMEDIDLKILKYVTKIVIEFIESKKIKLTNKYDLAIYQSYKRLHDEATEFENIRFEFEGGKFGEFFNFDTADVSTLISIENEIPFKRCDVTLLPIFDLNTLKCESSFKEVINLENLNQDEVGDLTLQLLKLFGQKCIYSGDYLYKNN